MWEAEALPENSVADLEGWDTSKKTDRLRFWITCFVFEEFEFSRQLIRKIRSVDPLRLRTTMWEAQAVWEYSVRDLGTSDTSKKTDMLRFAITVRRFVESQSFWVRILSRTRGIQSLSSRNEYFSVTTVRNLRKPIQIDALNRLCHLCNPLKRCSVANSWNWIKNILFYFNFTLGQK